MPYLGIGEIVKASGEAISAPASSLGDAWHALIGDRVSHWRLKNAMKLQEATIAEAKRLGLRLNTARIPERYAFAWFEEATKQDEPELQVLFARLLARAAAGDNEAEDRRLIPILSQLTPTDAAIFQRIYSDQPFPDTGPYSETRSIAEPMTLAHEKLGWPRDWMKALVERFHPEAEKSVEHLIVVGLLAGAFYTEGRQNAGFLPAPQDSQGRLTDWRQFIQSHAALRAYVTHTKLGLALHSAVKE